MPTSIITHTTAYRFSELLEREGDGVISHDAAQTAREKFADRLSQDTFWSEFVTEQWQEALDQIGFTDAKISWSIGFGGGHGACFTSGVDAARLLQLLCAPLQPQNRIDGDPEDFQPWVLWQFGKRQPEPYAGKHARQIRRLLPFADLFSISVDEDRRQRNTDENAADLSLDFRDNGHHIVDRIVRVTETVQELAEDLRRDLCHAIHTSLEQEYEYRISDEAISEDADANGNLFDAKGNLV